MRIKTAIILTLAAFGILPLLTVVALTVPTIIAHLEEAGVQWNMTQPGAFIDSGLVWRWVERSLILVFAAIAVLSAVIFLTAGAVARSIGRYRQELVNSLERLVAGEQEVFFRGSRVVETRQLASELTNLAAKHAELHAGRRRAEEESSRRHQAQLDDFIQARTCELSEANRRLQDEIQERVRIQQILENNEKRLRTILDSIHTGIFIVDTSTGGVVYANPAAANLVGVEGVEELVGRPCQECFGENGTQLCAPGPRGRRSGTMEFGLTRRDGGKVTVLRTIMPFTFMFDDRSLLLASMTDISEQKMVMREKQRLEEQLYHSQKLEAVGLLAGGVAHDFNNLLTVIQGFTSLAIRKLDQADPMLQHLLRIKEGSGKAAILVRQLLLFSRRQPMRPVPLNVNNSIIDLLKMLGRLIGENIEIRTELASEPWMVEADRGNLDQVLMNLAVNARDAMPDGGILTIRTANAEFDHVPATAPGGQKPGHFVCLSVSDSGHGIAAEVMGHIFEPFFTTKEEGKGTGLGLAVIYGIVRQHGGWVEVASVAGSGATFTIYLPARPRPEGEKAVLEPDASMVTGAGMRVLLVEDEPNVGAFTQHALEEHGFLVSLAQSAEAALAIFEAEKGRFDLLMSDVVLPGQSGIELVDAILSQKPRLPVILSSGYADQRSQWSVILERGFHSLQKPYDVEMLLRMIGKVLTRQVKE